MRNRVSHPCIFIFTMETIKKNSILLLFLLTISISYAAIDFTPSGSGTSPAITPNLQEVTDVGASTTNDITIGDVTKDHRFGVEGSGTTNQFVALFKQYGITAENSATGSSVQNKMVSIQGANGAFFHGRDVTNDIDFVMGTSIIGEAFAGAMTADDMSLRTNNKNRLTIKANTGNIGIGKSNPSGKLDVVGQILATHTGFPVLGFTRTTTATGGSLGGISGIASAMELKTTTSGEMTEGFGGGIVFTLNDITTGGNNFISRIYARRDSADNSGLLQFFTGTTGSDLAMTIRDDGDVGIGTPAPSEKLDVNGNIISNADIEATTFTLKGKTIDDWSDVNQSINANLSGTYSGGSAFVCVYNNGTLYASETACP